MFVVKGLTFASRKGGFTQSLWFVVDIMNMQF